MAELSREEQEQREHFNQWQNVYEEHYDDKYSAQLRERFYLEPALRGVDLKGRRALEAMCGSGQSTGFLLEIRRLLKPGGVFAFVEPHTGSLPDLARRIWYRLDRSFLPNERAVDVERLARDFAGDFELLHVEHHGGPGYLLVLNSLIFRIPHRFKRFYAPPLIWLDSVLDRVLGKRLSCFVVAQLRRK